MSADNGIYILNLADQSRVIHAQAIDNLWWSFVNFQVQQNPVSTRVYEYFKDVPAMTKPLAHAKAVELEDEIMKSDFPVLEYGISSIDLPITWAELQDDAKDHAIKEIRAIQNDARVKSGDTRWNSDLRQLEELLTAVA